MCFINPNNKELCEKLGNYFYKKAKVVSDGRKYWKGLKKCGFETCEGLLTSYVEKNNKGQGLVSWQLYYTLQELPGTAASLEEEAEALRELVNSKKVKIRNWTEESFNGMVENAKNKREW